MREREREGKEGGGKKKEKLTFTILRERRSKKKRRKRSGWPTGIPGSLLRFQISEKLMFAVKEYEKHLRPRAIDRLTNRGTLIQLYHDNVTIRSEITIKA